MQQQEGYSFPRTSTDGPGRRWQHPGWQHLTSLMLAASLAILGPGGAYGNDNEEGSVEESSNEVVEEQLDEVSGLEVSPEATFATPTRSSPIVLSRNNRFAVVVNKLANSVSIIEVVDNQGRDVGRRLIEIPVGNEPRFVALTPDDSEAYVTTAANNRVVVIRLTGPNPFRVTHTIQVPREPRGITMTPNGQYAFVASHTEGVVAVISTSSKQVINTVRVGGNPQAIAITNNGDSNDNDERVFATLFFGESRNQNRPDGLDDSKQGVVRSFTVGDALAGTVAVAKHVLNPRDSGFTGDRRGFCLRTRRILQDSGPPPVGEIWFNNTSDGDDGAGDLANEFFCPDPNSNDASLGGPIGSNPQGVYPNALWAALIRGRNLFVPNEGASPEGPVRFNVNVHYLVGVIDLNNGREKTGSTVNLNQQVSVERNAGNTEGIDGLFGNTPPTGGIDADAAGRTFLLVSRGGNYVFKATANEEGRLSIGAPNVVRFQTGNIPSGVVMSSDGRRGYTVNEVNTSITAFNLVNNRLIQLDINSSNPPAPGTRAHRLRVGQLVFDTALGTQDNGVFGRPVRSIIPLLFKGKASDNAWSSCASCHPDGRTDNVVWQFETGPRKSLDLVSMFAKFSERDQRILNWSAVRGANTDFNNNARDIQGGKGFAGDPPPGDRIFNHGEVKGVTDALDALQEWPVIIRPLNFPSPDAATERRGRTVFAANCASCHGGAKWTKSRTSPVYDNDPTYPENPIGVNFFDTIQPFDDRLEVANPQIVAVNDPRAGRLTFLDNVGTFNAASILEIRGAARVGGQNTTGFGALGGLGFNSPSMLNVAYHAPFFHDGSALNLNQVFARHKLPQFAGAPTINSRLSVPDRNALREFLNGIDAGTDTFESDTDRFLDRLGLSANE